MAISDEESFVKSIILKIYQNIIFRESVNFDIVVACKYFLRFKISFAAYLDNLQLSELPGLSPARSRPDRPDLSSS